MPPAHTRLVTAPRLLLLVALVAGVALALPALAPVAEVEPSDVTAAADAAPVPPSDPAALTLLQRAADVESALSWQGSEVIAVFGAATATAPASTVIADVEHLALVGSELRVVGGTEPAGMAAFAPDSAPFTGSSPLSSPFPDRADSSGSATSAGWAALLAKSFVVSVDGSDEIAGQPCQRVDIRLASGAIAARVWVSQVNALPLQRQVFDTAGQLRSYSTYTKMRVVRDEAVDDVGPDATAVGASGRISDGGAVGQRVGAAELTALGSAGWTVPARIGGLSLVDSRVFGAPLESAHSTGTLQLSYSDGLSTLCISEQHGHLAATLPTGWVREVRAQSRVAARVAIPERLAWTAAGRVFSIVSDTDDATLDLALRTLPRPAASTGYGPRMRRGLDRVGRWLTPTG